MKQWIVFGMAAWMAMPTMAQVKQKPMKFANNNVVAHRGAFKANGFPENSIASLQEAIRLGCTGSEFDVRMTADDSLIINHDEHYNKLLIEETTYTALQQFTLSNGEKLPTLREYLLTGMKANNKTRLVLEIKPSGMGKERAVKIVDAVVALVQSLQAEEYIVYISFDYNMMLRLKQLVPHAPMQYLEGDKSPGQLKADGIMGLDYHFSVFEKHPEWIAEAKKLGLVLNAWTVNAATKMDELMQQGFDFITTNEPELLLKKSKQRK
ncbi:glycerophosphodiester phosphodiesterase [Phnomibacter sp. MR]|uniref:glycerophosphodiester phosphodiesterase n=1 Tax=Phnomibacter sp. MR TaxID=3042318 RepID=UPI003A8072A2